MISPSSPRCDHLTELQHRGVKPDVVVDGEHRPRVSAVFADFAVSLGVHGQRLFADAMFAPKRGQGHFTVEPVGRGDMHHVYIRRTHQVR